MFVLPIANAGIPHPAPSSNTLFPLNNSGRSAAHLAINIDAGQIPIPVVSSSGVVSSPNGLSALLIGSSRIEKVCSSDGISLNSCTTELSTSKLTFTGASVCKSFSSVEL